MKLFIKENPCKVKEDILTQETITGGKPSTKSILCLKTENKWTS